MLWEATNTHSFSSPTDLGGCRVAACLAYSAQMRTYTHPSEVLEEGQTIQGHWKSQLLAMDRDQLKKLYSLFTLHTAWATGRFLKQQLPLLRNCTILIIEQTTWYEIWMHTRVVTLWLNVSPLPNLLRLQTCSDRDIYNRTLNTVGEFLVKLCMYRYANT